MFCVSLCNLTPASVYNRYLKHRDLLRCLVLVYATVPSNLDVYSSNTEVAPVNLLGLAPWLQLPTQPNTHAQTPGNVEEVVVVLFPLPVPI